jgi:hypothetical protein
MQATTLLPPLMDLQQMQKELAFTEQPCAGWQPTVVGHRWPGYLLLLLVQTRYVDRPWGGLC